jgi:hypothetical protein
MDARVTPTSHVWEIANGIPQRFLDGNGLHVIDSSHVLRRREGTLHDPLASARSRRIPGHQDRRRAAG